MDPWIWAVLLLIVGLSLVVLDIFLPSGGIVAFLAACAVVGSVILAFVESPGTGFAMLTAAVLGLPTVVATALYWLPETPMGRRILLQPPSSEDVSPDPAEREALRGMLGHIGRAKSKMLPSGIVVIDDRTFDAVSEGMPIDEGLWIRVIEVRGNRLIVEGIPEPKPTASGEDPLAQPVDWDSLPGDPSDRPTCD
jgi:membrane-bound serine protease (ClpP class)